MKKLITLLLVLVTLNSYSQPIDYNNFDTEIATLRLKEAFLNFRDTMTTYGSNNEYKHLDDYPVLNEKKHLIFPRWSEWVYKNISIPNTTELSNTTSLYHPDIEEWLELHQEDMVNAYYKDYYKGDKNLQWFKETSYITYSENAIRVPIELVEDRYITYEDLATTIILTYEKSKNHRCQQRSPMLRNGKILGLNGVTNAIFGCHVMYNNKTKQVKSTINFIR